MGKRAKLQEQIVCLPKVNDLTWDIYLYFLRKEILNLAIENCEGCKFSLDGQMGHVDGCLQSLDENIDKYIGEAKGRVVSIFRPNCLKLIKALSVNEDYLTKGSTSKIRLYSSKKHLKNQLLKWEPNDAIKFYEYISK